MMGPYQSEDFFVLLGAILGTRNPTVEIVVVFRQKQIKTVETGQAEAGEPRIGEAAQDQVHLAGAAVPAPHPEPPPPRLDRLVHARPPCRAPAQGLRDHLRPLPVLPMAFLSDALG